MEFRHWIQRLYRWHAWAGLLSGIFLIIICVSGSVAVFKPELTRAVDWGNYDFDIKPAGRLITADEALDVVTRAYPGVRATVLRLPALPGTIESHGPTYSVRVTALKGKPARDILVDPYQARIVAEGDPARGWGNWLRQLHLRLLYGEFWGRWVVGVFGLVLTFATISGLFIYLRFNGSHWWPKLRLGRGSRIFWADMHKIVGIGSLAFNLLFGLTGAVLGLETLYFRYAPRAAAVAPATRPAPLVALRPGMIDTALAAARTAMPHATPASVDLQFQKTGTLRVRMDHPAAALIAEGKSNVIVDARTGSAVEVNDASSHSPAARLYYSMEPLHFGRIGGWTLVKLTWGLMGLTGGLLAITGFGIYLMRHWKKRALRRRMATVR